MNGTPSLARLRTQIEWLERSYPKAAASLREELEETFTINHLGLSPRLRKCLATTNIIAPLAEDVQSCQQRPEALAPIRQPGSFARRIGSFEEGSTLAITFPCRSTLGVDNCTPPD